MTISEFPLGRGPPVFVESGADALPPAADSGNGPEPKRRPLRRRLDRSAVLAGAFRPGRRAPGVSPNSSIGLRSVGNRKEVMLSTSLMTSSTKISLTGGPQVVHRRIPVGALATEVEAIAPLRLLNADCGH